MRVEFESNNLYQHFRLKQIDERWECKRPTKEKGSKFEFASFFPCSHRNTEEETKPQYIN